MKMHSRILLAALLGLSLVPAPAQMGGGSRAPQFKASLIKLFGDHTAFSATLENQVKLQSQSGDMDITMPGKIAFDGGKARFEMDMGQMKNSQMPSGSAEQMKQMGIDKWVIISRPDTRVSYMVYPSLECYTQMPVEDPDAGKPASAFKLETTELGRETIDGHPCVKNKAIVTDSEGQKHESTVWNATDLKNFPVKIDTTQEGMRTVMLFKDVKLAKPAADLFEPPSGYKKMNSMMDVMQEGMKRMGGPGGMTPGGPPRGGGQ